MQRLPRVGDRVRTTDYGGQQWLYHVAECSSLRDIARYGLRPGTGSRWDTPTAREHSRGRVFFSTQPDKWLHSVSRPCLVRVLIETVRCYYDGGLWLYDGDEDEDSMSDGRLADCFSLDPVPARLLQRVKP